MRHQIAPFGVRMPESLKEWVKDTAHRENRSANSQIVHLLAEAKKAAGEGFGDTAPAAGSNSAALAGGASINHDTGDVADE